MAPSESVSEAFGSTSSSLIARVRRHDQAAWERFADLYTPLVYSWARRGGLREADASDIVQEVFRSVASKIEDFGSGHEGSSFKAWLWAITRNHVRLHYRKQADRPIATGGTDAAQQLAEIPDWVEDADEPSSADDRRALLDRALRLIRNDFAEHTWQAFWRVAIEGHAASEVAADLGIQASAVRQAKYRVLCRLQEELKGE